MNRRADRLFLLAATASALAVVPDSPHRHLDEPAYWGLIGFLVVIVLILGRASASFSRDGGSRRVVRAFIVGVQVIYVASWMRWGGTAGQLALQLGGLCVWIALAWRAGRSDPALWGGCVAHALWDAVHFGRVGFIPDWYVAACLAADLGLGAFVLLTLSGPDRRAGVESAPPSGGHQGGGST